jgi:hypothetical protein
VGAYWKAGPPGLIAEKHRPRWLELLFGEEKRAIVHIGADNQEV